MNVFDLFATISLDDSKYKRGLSSAQSLTQKAGSAIGNALKNAAKVSAAAVGAAGTAVVALTKSSVSQYAEYEQLVGGIETLFKGNATEMLKYADNAFKTAGLAANEYMDTAIQSAAAMINSLGGDTQKAAKMTDLSITDMSDNMNKMGTNMQSLQDAYRGFSRSNFTMLDNLALGYAGTKEGMQSLLDNAEKISGIKYDISSYSDIVQAIHVIQTEMGITGTTAKEAESTISGSLNQVKAAWANLVTGFADGNANISNLVGNTVKTATVAFKNLLPAVKQALGGISEALKVVAPIVIKETPKILNQILPATTSAIGNLLKTVGSVLPGLIRTLAPVAISAVQNLLKSVWSAIPSLINSAKEIFNAGMEVVEQLTSGIKGNLSKIIPAAMDMIMKLSGELREKAGKLVDAGLKLIETLAKGLIDNIPVFIKTVPTIISNLAGIINDNAPKLIASGIKIIGELIKGIIKAIPTLVQEFPKVIKAIVDVWSAFNWISLGKNAITFIKDGINALKTELPKAIKSIGENAVKLFKGIDWAATGKAALTAIVNGIKTVAKLLTSALKTIGTDGVKVFKNINWAAVGKTVLTLIAKAMTASGKLLLSALKSAGTAAFNAFKSIDWQSLGLNLLRGIAAGITGGLRIVTDAARQAAKSALDAAKNFLGIHSPSKVGEKVVGLNYDLGIAKGIAGSKKYIEESAFDAAESAISASQKALSKAKLMYSMGFSSAETNWPNNLSAMGTIPAKTGYQNDALYGLLTKISNQLDLMNADICNTVESSGNTQITLNGRELGRVVRSYA